MTGSPMAGAKINLDLNARLVRRLFRRTRKSWHYGARSLAESPVLFANSFPKSGTHLLTQVLAGFAHLGPAVVSGLPAVVTFRGDTGKQRPVNEIVADLLRLLPGDIAYGHIHAFPEAVECLVRQGFAAYFILRDPRDVAISHVHYLTDKAPKHIHHHYFTNQLHDFDSRLFASIQGVSVEKLFSSMDHDDGSETLPLPDIRTRFEPYLGWFEHPQVLALRYEDFLTHRAETITRVLDHALERGFKTKISPEQAVQVLDHNIEPARSPTFRSGKSGGWRDAFTPAHKQAFKQVSGDLLQRLGYECEAGW